MDSSNECSKCPIMGGFCWKSPVHWILFLAVLPFTVKGVGLIGAWIGKLVTTVAGN